MAGVGLKDDRQGKRYGDGKIKNDLEGKHQLTFAFQPFHFLFLSTTKVRAHQGFEGYEIVTIGVGFVIWKKNFGHEQKCAIIHAEKSLSDL